MEAQPGVVQPQSFPWRNLTARPENNGMIVNPVGYGDIGGLTSASRYPANGSLLIDTSTGSSAKSATKHLKGNS